MFWVQRQGAGALAGLLAGWLAGPAGRMLAGWIQSAGPADLAVLY